MCAIGFFHNASPCEKLRVVFFREMQRWPCHLVKNPLQKLRSCRSSETIKNATLGEGLPIRRECFPPKILSANKNQMSDVATLFTQSAVRL